MGTTASYTWLGIVLDTYEGSECMSVTERRIAKVKSHTDTILGRMDYMAVYARFFWPREYCSLWQLIKCLNRSFFLVCFEFSFFSLD